MHIALLAPILLPVPPFGYGGTERVVHQLAEGLVARGHRVTLFASGDSHGSAELRSLYPRNLESLGSLGKEAYHRLELAHSAWAYRQADEFDLIHNHTKLSGLLFSRFSRTPSMTTLHNDFSPERRLVCRAFRDHAYVSLSRAQQARLPELNYLGHVYNGLDLKPAVYRERKGDYLLFLGRLDAAKGAHIAARIAAALDYPLIMAGRLAPEELTFFDREVAPHLDGQRRRYVGEVGGPGKWGLLAGARALLFPIQWAEPFGLVMVEAMACGTPVVASLRGAVPEVVLPGKTGILVPAEAELDAYTQAVREALTLSPMACRDHARAHFSFETMVEGYLQLYQKLVSSSSSGAP